MSIMKTIGLAIFSGTLLFSAVVIWPLNTEGAVPLSTGTLVCLDCHRQPNVDTNEGVAAANTYCYRCHGPNVEAGMKAENKKPLHIQSTDFSGHPHQFVACIQCHLDVARSPHVTESGAACLGCHSVHGEGDAHAPHLRVDCQACHFEIDKFRLEKTTFRVKPAEVNDQQQPVNWINHKLTGAASEKNCIKCHKPGNAIGAPARVLPAKGALCVMCHPSALTLSHPIYWIASLLFVSGLFFMVRFWFIGSVSGESASLHRKVSLSAEGVWQAIFSHQFFTLLKILIVDIFLGRRILKENVGRWSMHSFIFMAMILRLLLSLFTGVVYAISPNSGISLILIDKNHPFTALTYDLLGLFILVGVVWAVCIRYVVKPVHVTSEFEDNITLGIVGLLTLCGFLAEAVRMVMTGVPPQLGGYAIVGYPMSRLISGIPMDWSRVYPVLWYIHAVLGACFIAYLPFGKLKHVFNVPLTYFIESVAGIKRDKRL
ncbi:MAG: hypothetical protein HKM93_10975 [Desulfobacteraceae bacterium]|nr:hypothetical protein [Desulfobacteraceae bacterium]